jgi:hypothetical protein
MLRSLGAFLLLGLVAGAGARAEPASATFGVTATVLERVTLSAAGPVARLQVSEADVRRGFKDVSARYVITSTADPGYMLRLALRLGLARRIEVTGLATGLVLQDQDVEVFRPRAVADRDLVLGYRILLADSVQPGDYDWPVHVAATPL